MTSRGQSASHFIAQSCAGKLGSDSRFRGAAHIQV